MYEKPPKRGRKTKDALGGSTASDPAPTVGTCSSVRHHQARQPAIPDIDGRRSNQSIQGEEEEDGDDEDDDDGDDDIEAPAVRPLTGQPEAEGCCPPHVRKYAKRVANSLKGKKVGQGLDRRLWPTFCHIVPSHSIWATTDHDIVSLERTYMPKMIVFWAPEIFYPM